MTATDRATANAQQKAGPVTGRLPQLALMGVALFGLLGWLVLLGGVAAITDWTSDDDRIQTGLLWVVTLMFLFWLVTLFVLAGIGMKKVAVLRRAKTGLLWFLAIIAAWMGVQAQRLAELNDSFDRIAEGNIISDPDNSRGRIRAALAGVILCLMSIFAMGIVLSLLADNDDVLDKVTKAGAHGGEAAAPVHGMHGAHAAAPMPTHASQVPAAGGQGQIGQAGPGVAHPGVHTGTG